MSCQETGTRILVSVSKRYFKRAVHRNRIKRQLRESYRLQKHLLQLPEGTGLRLAFLWNSAETLPTAVVMQKMQKLLLRVQESLIRPEK